MSKEFMKIPMLFNFVENCERFLQFDLRNSYKLTAQFKLKTIEQNCELCLRSMNRACLDLVRGRRKLGYRLPLIGNSLDGLMK